MSLRFLSLFLFASVAAADELRVCADPDNLPYSRRDESGFENRIARLAARELGAELVYTWHAQQLGFVRKSVGEKRCDVWMGVPAGFERLMTTRPYYRSTYVFVWKQRALRSFDDAGLKRLRIGVQVPGDDFAATPPGHALALRGAIDNVVGFSVYGARPAAARIVDALSAGTLDAAVVWGPQAAYFAAAKNLPFAPAKPPRELEGMPFEFSIAIGVRRGEKALRDALDGVLERRRAEIDALLAEFRVPRVK